MTYIVNGISHVKLYNVIKTKIRVALERNFVDHYRMVFYTCMQSFIVIRMKLTELRHKTFRKWDFQCYLLRFSNRCQIPNMIAI